MSKMTLPIPPEAEGQRLDSWLAEAIPGLSRSAAQRLMEEGAVLIGGKPVRKNHRLGGGESCNIAIPDIKPVEAQAQDIPLDIVFEDDWLVVVNKPRGMVVHPAPGNPDCTLVNALVAHCGASLSGIGGVARPGIVHRLDKDTSGLLIVAKTDAAHAALSAQLKNRTLGRVYEAVVRGKIGDDSGIIEGDIARSPKNRKKMAVIPGGRPAKTEFWVIARYNGFTHVRCKLHTGRTHQIRVHFAHTGHPVAGDTVYGGKGDKSGLAGQCLHARTLEFIHPADGEVMSFSAPLPEYFTGLLDKISRL